MTQYARTVPVLMYHHISTSPGMITVSPANFAAQMAYLAKAGYRTTGSAEFAAYLAGTPLPRNSIVITFDDGYLDNWVHAHPVLERHGFTALCFLVTAWPGEGAPRPHAGARESLPTLLSHKDGESAIENGEPDRVIVRWSEIDAMRRANTFEFHSHTHRHVRWDHVEPDRARRRALLRQDLIDSRLAFDRLGGASDHLCWPQGYFDDDYRQVALEAGFRYFYTCEMGPNQRGKALAGSTAVERSVFRLEVRDRPPGWLASRLWVHSRPQLSRLYLKMKR
ncbi:polysaccharide deacetylase family protein [Paraburkholderia sp. GAS42]|uniref:polysaccharide deacetylase family protein n=1 Tax=Paraburkholderia sp. GAS42 TaxID=3035135 RepID=UPI003D196BD6